MAEAKTIDTLGRLVLGKELAGETYLCEKQDDGVIVLRPAITIPKDQAWFWKNKKTQSQVKTAIEDVKKRGKKALKKVTLDDEPWLDEVED